MNEQIKISTGLQQLLTVAQAWEYRAIPIKQTSSEIEFVTDVFPVNDFAKDELEMLFGKTITFSEISTAEIDNALNRYYRQKSNNNIKLNVTSDNFVFSLIEEAKEYGCSDIHIETYENTCRIRYRIDGKLIEKYIVPENEYPVLVNKIKIKSNIDIAEKRLPQDGRIKYSVGNDSFDIRVSVLPTLYGEKIVLRLLSKDTTNIDINRLGFNQQQLNDYLSAIKKLHGIVLISGPTGSGKTTTLYATLKILNKTESNILTIEDPIEYTLDGINQVQLKESIGLTFANTLRTFLRQDPDIIMLGEIRDGETAQMAIRAALTGHLVLSTIHTNSAWGTISRLIDMGVPSFLLSNTLSLSVAQRLVRVLCPHCKKEIDVRNEVLNLPELTKLYGKISKDHIPIGCPECYYTGYKGRMAVYEVIPVDSEINGFIRSNTQDIMPYFKKKNIKTLGESAFAMYSQGLTSFDEIYPILLSTN
ncbi:MAG: GspE/PulE family protein [Bacteroidales bacterium]|nr:GspE/PulE family protein [Bacteroidales bacterium]